MSHARATSLAALTDAPRSSMETRRAWTLPSARSWRSIARDRSSASPSSDSAGRLRDGAHPMAQGARALRTGQDRQTATEPDSRVKTQERRHAARQGAAHVDAHCARSSPRRGANPRANRARMRVSDLPASSGTSMAMSLALPAQR